MAVKKVTRKVISKASTSVKEVEEVTEVHSDLQKSGSLQSGETTPMAGEAGRFKRVCFFCQSKVNPSYTDSNVLRRFVTDRAKIVAKLKSNLCSKHQRFATKEIKYARHLSLLPFTPKV